MIAANCIAAGMLPRELTNAQGPLLVVKCHAGYCTYNSSLYHMTNRRELYTRAYEHFQYTAPGSRLESKHTHYHLPEGKHSK